MVRDYLDKWIVNANEIFSQRPKLYVIHLVLLIFCLKKERNLEIIFIGISRIYI